MKCVGWLFLFLLIPGIALADNVLTGKSFTDMCEVSKETNVPSSECTSYIAGMYEAYEAFNQWELIADTLCMPTELNYKKMAMIATKQLQQIEAYEEKAANQMVLNALADAYPCK